MTEELWNVWQEQLAQEYQTPVRRLCVGCWYRRHHQPFPATESSSLCADCCLLTRILFEQQRTHHEKEVSCYVDHGFIEDMPVSFDRERSTSHVS